MFAHLAFEPVAYLLTLPLISADRWQINREKIVWVSDAALWGKSFLPSLTEELLASFGIRTLLFDKADMEFSLVDLRADARFVSDPKSTFGTDS